MAASAAIFFIRSSVVRQPPARREHACANYFRPRITLRDDLLIWANGLPGARVLIVSCRKLASKALRAALFPVLRLPLRSEHSLENGLER